MKRILSLILALLLAACGVFSACAEDSESGRPPQPGGSAPESMGAPPDLPDGEMPGGPGGTPPEGGPGGTPPDGMPSGGDQMIVGTPDAGTTQAAGSGTDSAGYASYADMIAAYAADIAGIEAGDAYGKNIVDLYNPLNYIGADGTEDPVWMRIVCGAPEGDISMMNSLNIRIKALNAGVDAVLEWQWEGGHVPGEILGSSLPLWVDAMYGKYVDGAAAVTGSGAAGQTANGTSQSPAGKDLSSWVTLDENGFVSFSLADAASYRTAGASKATPGFDVIDYGQEDYVFGSSTADARHWSVWVLKALQENRETLEPLFNR